MHRSLAALLVASAALSPIAVLAAPADVIATLQPAVVNINTITHAAVPPVPGNMASQQTVSEHTEQGSGFFVADDGLIVTNRHAIAGADEIMVTLSDSTRLRACVVAVAAASDIALLRVHAGKQVPTVAFGNSEELRPGDPVFVIGNPLGLGGTVTAGIVSALDRNTPQSGFGPFFQFDASLNHGSSGGPVFDARGQVVGVATALFSPGTETGSVGLGLAIPGNDARVVVGRLLAGGKVHLGWIGAHIQAVSADLAATVGLPAATGAIVTELAADGPAARAGVEVGDVILRLGDVAENGPRGLNHDIAASAIGSLVPLAIWRAGAETSANVVIGELPAEKAEEAPLHAACSQAKPAAADLGLVFGALTGDARAKLGLGADAAGVLIDDVHPNTAAADRGIAAGAVIVNVNRHPVVSPDEAEARISAARASGAHFVMLLVRDTQGLRWLALPLG